MPCCWNSRAKRTQTKPRTDSARRAVRAATEVVFCSHTPFSTIAEAPEIELQQTSANIHHVHTLCLYPGYISTKAIIVTNQLVTLLPFMPLLAQARPRMQCILLERIIAQRLNQVEWGETSWTTHTSSSQHFTLRMPTTLEENAKKLHFIVIGTT